MRSLLLLALLTATAAAEPRLHGFITAGPGELRGTVSDADGKPVAGAYVHIGDAVTSTARDGTYKRLPPEMEMQSCTGLRHRDCSQPDLSKMLTQPWLTPVTSK